MPVLPQEDPKELEDKTQQAIAAMKPRNPRELDLVCRAVRLAGELDRAERVATAHLAHRVRMATRSCTDTVSAEELKKVHDLGSKLFFQAAIGPGYSDSTADDYPAVIVRRLEESAEGYRWLLTCWAEILNLLDREAAWGEPEIVRFVASSGDTIPNCLGEFREIRESNERTSVAARAIREARLEQPELSGSSQERMVYGPTATSGGKRIDFSTGIAWFGDIIK